MRRLILILMIVLLPLRSWAGDAMSVAMATATATRVAVEAMPADCPMHASSDAAKADDSGVEHPSPTTSVCDVCDLCLPFADLVSPVLTSGGAGKHHVGEEPSIGYLSADQTRDLRPPIR